MKYLISGIAGFLLTLLVSLPFQNILKQKEAKGEPKALSLNKARYTASDMDVKIQPIVRMDARSDEPRIKFLPQYPVSAAAKKIEGFVTVSFRVSKDGSVQGLKVMESSPPQIFDEAALDAVSKWSFATSTRISRVGPESQKLRLNFQLGRAVASDTRLPSGF